MDAVLVLTCSRPITDAKGERHCGFSQQFPFESFADTVMTAALVFDAGWRKRADEGWRCPSCSIGVTRDAQ